MKTLIITNSLDVTVDFIIEEMGSEKFIRINYDRPKDWELSLSSEKINIKSDNLDINITDKEISKLIWRKPFIAEPECDPYTEKFHKSEWKFFLYEIMLFFRVRKCIFLNEPLPDFLFAKHYQLYYAKKYFVCPPMESNINHPIPPRNNVIAKSLSGTTFENGNVFYTTDISNEPLDDALWTVQEKIDKSHDLTVVYIYGEIFAFELNRKLFKGIDWRIDLFEVSLKWKKITLDSEFTNNIKKFMTEMSLCYGRLDFLSDSNGENPVFLEVNKNGQWGWLDPNRDNGLFKAMCRVYTP